MKRFLKWFGLVTFGALLPLLMAPTGGIPTLLKLTALGLGMAPLSTAGTLRASSVIDVAPIKVGFSGAGIANAGVVGFYDSGGIRKGFVGDGSSGDANINLACETNPCNLQLASTGVGTIQFNGSVFGPNCVYKHGTESRFSNTTLAADSNLTLTLTQNGYYKHTMWIELGAGGAGAGGFKWSFTGTAATSGRGESGVKNGVAFSNSEVSVLATVGTPIATLATATNDWIHTEGVMHITSAPQTVALQWAQNSSSADTTSVLGDSYMCIDRIE